VPSVQTSVCTAEWNTAPSPEIIIIIIIIIKSVDIALRSGRPRNPGSVPAKDNDFSFLRSVRAGSGVHTASYPVGKGGVEVPSPGVKREGHVVK
jgi:hypothetical protein